MEMGATMDLLPTFCAIAGVKPPSDRLLDGYDLSPLLLGKTMKSPRDRMFYWREQELYAVRLGPWKAHFITEGCYGMGPTREEHDPPQLYHLGHDPAEKYNLADVHPKEIARIQSIANEHKKSIQQMENQLNKR